MKQLPIVLLMVLLLILSAFNATAHAKELLAGTIAVSASENLQFTLSGEDRSNIIGGEIRLDEASFQITKISRRGVIGAIHDNPALSKENEHTVRYAVFSSSFSPNTATGQPRIASKKFINCEQAYNSYLAVYDVQKTRVKALGDTPYPTLLKDINSSDESVVYCFYSQPPERQEPESSTN